MPGVDRGRCRTFYASPSDENLARLRGQDSGGGGGVTPTFRA